MLIQFFSPQAVVDAVLAISKPNEPIDLYMVEIMEMKHKTESDTQSVLTEQRLFCYFL